MFLHTTKMRKILSLPSYIFEDTRLSLGAKGLYTQLYYSNDTINTLNDLTVYINNTEEELNEYYKELVENGYIIIKNNKCELLSKYVTTKSSKFTDIETAKEYANKIQPKKPSAYQIMVNIINGYDLTNNVKQLLIVYFTKRLNKVGRFAEDELHGYKVRAVIGELISFHLSEDEQLTSIQKSIDMEWFKFVPPNNLNNSYNKTFIKNKIKSGSYTLDDIENIKLKAKELEEKGQKGVY